MCPLVCIFLYFNFFLFFFLHKLVATYIMSAISFNTGDLSAKRCRFDDVEVTTVNGQAPVGISNTIPDNALLKKVSTPSLGVADSNLRVTNTLTGPLLATSAGTLTVVNTDPDGQVELLGGSNGGALVRAREVYVSGEALTVLRTTGNVGEVKLEAPLGLINLTNATTISLLAGDGISIEAAGHKITFLPGTCSINAAAGSNLELRTNGSGLHTFTLPSAMQRSYVWPALGGSLGQFLMEDGVGGLTWVNGFPLGGNPGDVLTTDGAGSYSWVTPPGP
jgi:hypothetical protein